MKTNILNPLLICAIIACGGCRSKTQTSQADAGETKTSATASATANQGPQPVAGTPAVASSKPSSVPATAERPSTFSCPDDANLPGVPILSAASPARKPTVRIALNLPQNDYFAGDPVPLRLTVLCPLTEEANVPSLKSAFSKPNQASRPRRVPAPVQQNWTSAVQWTLFRAEANAPVPYNANLDWPKFLSPMSEVALGNPAAQWVIPPEANLPVGTYYVRAIWNPRGFVDDRWLNGKSPAAAVKFTVHPPACDADKAAHAERLALYHYQRNNFPDVRRFAMQAIEMNPTASSAGRLELLAAYADSCLAMDDIQAGTELYRQILKLVPENSDIAAVYKYRLKVLEDMPGKGVFRFQP